MATHTVKFKIPEKDLGKADISFSITRDGEKFGELKISNGSVVWFPKNSPKGYKWGWKAIDEFFQNSKKHETR